MELSVGASASQLQELQVSLQVHSSREVRLTCIKVCEKNFVSSLSLFNDLREPAPFPQFPTQYTGFVSLPLKDPKALYLPNQFNEPNVTLFTYSEGRQCPNGSQSGQQNTPSSGGQFSVPTNYPTRSNPSGSGPSGEPSNNPSQSDDPRESGSGSDPPDPDPDSDPDSDPDDPYPDCPIGQPNCAICYYFEQRKVAIFGSKDGGRKSPDMELLFNEPIFNSSQPSSLPNVFLLNPASLQQQFATAADPSSLPATFASSSPSHQPIPCEQDPSSRRFLLPNVRVLSPQSEESPSSSLNPEFRVPEAPAYQPTLHSLLQLNVPRFRPSVAGSTSPLQQQHLIEPGSPSTISTIPTFDPQIQQPAHAYRSQLYQQTSFSPISTSSSETRGRSSRSPLRVPKFTPSQPQSFASPLQQLEYLVTGGPSPLRFTSQVEKVVRPSASSSAGSVQNIRPQSEPYRGILSEPLLRVPSVTPYRPPSMDTTTPEFSSPLQLQYFTRRSSLDVPRALDFSPQLQQPVRSHEPELYERRSLLKRHLTNEPNIRNISSQSSLPRDTSFQVPEVPVYEPEIKRPRTDSLPQFSVSRVRPSQAFGSALQQQQHLTFAGQPTMPTAETAHSQVRQPVRASIFQMYGRPSLRRHSIDLPHTLTMLPRQNEPASFEPVLRVPNVMRLRLRSRITDVPAFGSALQQQQSIPFRSRLNIGTAQSVRYRMPLQVRMFGSRSYQERHSSIGSLNFPTSQRQFRITSTSGSPLKQLEVLASRGPVLSDFNSQVEQLVSDPELYDRSSSSARSFTDVSSIRHVFSHTLRESSIETRPTIPSEFHPASQQEPFLRFMGPLDLSTPPVLISQSQQTVRARRIQRKRSSTGSLINVPSAQAVLPQPRASEREPKKKDPFSIAALLDLPEAQDEVPQFEEPINRSFEQQSDVPRVPPSQLIITTSHSLPQSDVLSVRPSQSQSQSADLTAFDFTLQQQRFLALGGQSRVPETEVLGPQLQQPVRAYGSRLYQQRPPSLRSRFEVPKVFSQSSEPQIRVSSVVPSRPQSSTSIMPAFSSALQQQRFLTFGSQSNVPTARATHSQIPQPIRASFPQLHERPSLRRHSISIPHTVTLLSHSSEPRGSSFEPSLNVATVTRSQPRSSVTNVPAFGSALQQQQYFTFGGLSNARPPRSRLRHPVRPVVSQLHERSSFRRHSISIPHTLTMLPQSNEPTSIEPSVPRVALPQPQPQPNITNVPAFGSALQQQQFLALGIQSNIPTRQALVPELEQLVRSRDYQPHEQMSRFREMLSPPSDPASVAPRFGAPDTIPSQPPPLIRIGSLSQQESLLPFDNQSSVPAAQFIPQSLQRNPSLVRRGVEAPNVPATLPSLQSRISVPKVPAYRPQLNKPIALSLPYLDLPKVSTIGPQLRPHGESAFRAVSPPRTDIIFDVGNLRGASSPELRRTDLRFADLVHTPRRL